MTERKSSPNRDPSATTGRDSLTEAAELFQALLEEAPGQQRRGFSHVEQIALDRLPAYRQAAADVGRIAVQESAQAGEEFVADELGRAATVSDGHVAVTVSSAAVEESGSFYARVREIEAANTAS